MHPVLLQQSKWYAKLETIEKMAKLIQAGGINGLSSMAHNQSNPELLQGAVATQDYPEIFSTLEQGKGRNFILIEGPPGIGKSVLLKQIAFRWSENKLLKKYRLVLLVHLGDPAVQQASQIDDLLKLFYHGYTGASEIITACSNYLFQSDGKDITFLFDGFDQFPNALQKQSLITDILERKVLPNCGLVVSSRSCAL